MNIDIATGDMSSMEYLQLSERPIEKIKTFLSQSATEDQVQILSGQNVVIDMNEPIEEGTSDTSPRHNAPHSHSIPLSPVQLQFLKDMRAALQTLREHLAKEGFNCMFNFEESTVTIGSSGSKSDHVALQIIKDSIVEMDFPADLIPFMDDGMNALPTGDDLEILVVKEGPLVKLIGMANAVMVVGDHLQRSQELLKSRSLVIRCVTINLSEHCASYLRQHKEHHLKACTSHLEGVQLEITQRTIEIKGPTQASEEAARIVNEEIKGVSSYPITLGCVISIITVGEVSQTVGEKYKCNITPQQHIGFMDQVVSKGLDDLTLKIARRKNTRIIPVINAIEKQEADVIVNTTNINLDLNQGEGVSSCILKAAGQTIQKQLREKYPNGLKHDEVAETGPGNLKTCKTIYHGALPYFPKRNSPNYQQKENDCFKWMISLVFNCLIRASEKGYQTIAFPAIGTGALKYPVEYVVQLMYKAIGLFKDDIRSGSIREIIFVIFPETQLPVKQLFLAHGHTNKLMTRQLAAVDEFHKEKRKKQTPRWEARVHVGNTLLQVVHAGVHEASDVTEAVLVLWTDEQIRDPKQNQGLKSTAPDKTDWMCTSYVCELPEAKCTADSTNLPSMTLLHSYWDGNSNTSAVKAIAEGIKTAAKTKCNTITIPIDVLGPKANTPLAAAGVVFNGLTKASDCVFVVTVMIPDVHFFPTFATKVIELCNNQLQAPVDIDKSPVAVELWTKSYADKASQSQRNQLANMLMTIPGSVYLVTSDSQERNKMAAEDFKKEVLKRLQTDPSHTSSTIKLG
ncbi:uncharacterized protein LOC125378263 isoform X1 [Haliotis rufescens]|uniref:uncharacterized protein LOC125378263 isoform X1 n=2 Tax=Haliotis rufescens TaxID=6454 RepID=UPI00201F2A17|nr:uncharacterized protein LOC125378263 isoform X1 [Haliotis rufescens]